MTSASRAMLPVATKMMACAAAAPPRTASDSPTARRPSRERLTLASRGPCKWPWFEGIPSGEQLRLRLVELGVRDRALFLQLGELGELVHRGAARSLADVRVHVPLRLGLLLD